MKSMLALGSLGMLAALTAGGCQTEVTPQALRGPYLGMTPRGDVPELFAPGVVADVYWEHSGAVFTPDGNEVFWSIAINEGRSPRQRRQRVGQHLLGRRRRH